jgi:hypothetical protein
MTAPPGTLAGAGPRDTISCDGCESTTAAGRGMNAAAQYLGAGSGHHNLTARAAAACSCARGGGAQGSYAGVQLLWGVGSLDTEPTEGEAAASAAEVAAGLELLAAHGLRSQGP